MNIDMRRLSRLPLLPVISCTIDSAFRYVMVARKINNIDPPLHRSSPFIGGQRCQPIQMGHSLHIRGCGGGGDILDTIIMSMAQTHKTEL
jgi:hypothetical protein